MSLVEYIMGVDNVTITKECGVTGKEYSVTVPTDKYLEWQGGELIQLVFPEMSIQDREFLISGNTPEEWAEMFPPIED